MTKISLSRFQIILGLILALFAYLVLDGGGRSFMAPPIIFLVLALIFIFFNNLDKKLKNPLPKFKKSLFLPLSIFLVVLICATIFSVSLYDSLPVVVLFFAAILIFFIISQLAFQEKHLLGIFYFILGLTLLLSVIAIYFFLTSELSGPLVRMFGTFYWPNPLAGFLLFGIPIALFLFWQNQNPKYKFWLLAANALILSVFVLTYSKGAFLSFVPPLILLIWYFRSKLKKEFVFKIVLLILLSSILVFGFINLRKTTYDFFKHPIVPKDKSQVTSLTRISYWKGAMEIFLDNKLIGTGPDTFKLVYPQYQESPVAYSKFPHNFYLKILSETGIFGFLSFSAFILGLIFIGIKLIRGKNQLAILSLPIFAGILGSLLHIGIDLDFAYPAIFLYFWFFAGVLYSLYLGKDKSLPKRYFKFNILSILLILILFIGSILLFFSDYNLKIASNLEDQGKIVEAKEYYEKNLGLPQKNPKTYYYLGRIEYLQGNYYKSVDYTQKAISLRPIDDFAYYLLGVNYFKMGDLGKAKLNFKKAISLNPLNRPSFYTDLSITYLSLDQKDKARETVEAILPFYTEKTIDNLMKTEDEKKQLRRQIKTLKKILADTQ